MCRRRYSECRLRCFATTCKLSELSRRPFSHGCVFSDCLRVSHTATWLKPAVHVVGVGPRCGTPASASASAASNVLHVTRLRKIYMKNSRKSHCTAGCCSYFQIEWANYLSSSNELHLRFISVICAPRAHDKSKVGGTCPSVPYGSGAYAWLGGHGTKPPQSDYIYKIYWKVCTHTCCCSWQLFICIFGNWPSNINSVTVAQISF